MKALLNPSLEENRARLAAALGWPDNLGIEMRPLSVGPAPALLVWADGLAHTAALEGEILGTLPFCREGLTPEQVSRLVPRLAQRFSEEVDDVTHAVLHGAAALLVDGWRRALIIGAGAADQHSTAERSHVQSPAPFARTLTTNVTLLRKRLPVPEFRAVRVKPGHARSDKVALVYLEGKADPAVVCRVRRWARQHAGEERAGRGELAGATAVFGLMPRFTAVRWPDKAALLLEAGYVLLLTDRIELAQAAPVTMATWFLSATDFGLPYPVRRWWLRVRLFLYGVVLCIPGTVVALMNYHQEMLPTSFLLAIASARENAPFGALFEVLALEGLVELARQTTVQLPNALSNGAALLALLIVSGLAVFSGFVGPLPALAAATGALLSMALPGYSGAYFFRLWRFYLLAGAVLMGFFGMATMLAIMLAYILQARSWGVPVLGSGGLERAGRKAASASRRAAVTRPK